jgi:two-component system, response regulator PdtaR
VIPLRILLIEDQAIIAMLMERVLMAMGHTVCAVEATEAGAVAAAAQHRPQMMIVDARLRRGNGVAAVATILRQGFVPHVFVSGDPLEGLGKGAVALLKPFTETELAVAVQRAWDARPSA